MGFALNNPKIDMSLNKEIKPNLRIIIISYLKLYNCVQTNDYYY